MQIFDNKFVSYIFNIALNTIEEHWKPESITMNEDDLKEVMIKLTLLFKEYKPKYFISAAENFAFPVPPDLQIWIDKTVAPVALSIGLERIARIFSKDFLVQLSLEQFAEEIMVGKIKTKFFSNIEDAHLWLNNVE